VVFVDEGDADVGGEVGVFPDDVGAGDVTGSAVADLMRELVAFAEARSLRERAMGGLTP